MTLWPLDRWDYLTVCDNHPTPYRSAAGRLAELGEPDPDGAPHEANERPHGWGYRKHIRRVMGWHRHDEQTVEG